MRASRGMGVIAPSKMPSGTKKARRDDTDFTQFAEGGMATGKWIQGAIKKPGALRAEMGVKGDKPIPAKKLAAAAKKPGKMGQRARLAETLKGLK
ncbi:hypothetical protein UFOVP48_76 [uncultured Caudovirales phage]|uniref:Uncharacterized protein n=1 Tax=uncultured Caudovirales phage TaxID=2100421 RepID=A0A6J5KRB1_9CAUD|nr:hypothetical protein UFOVP48_76 [uncultured Caudovirales phage]